MIFFPNAKINIGLNIISKRDDGFHNLETIFYPIPLTDILEFIVPGKNIKTTSIQLSGTNLGIANNENICIKTYNMLAMDYSLPNLQMHLHKIIPSGAGLGGGSSDAGFLLKHLNQYFNLNISEKKLTSYASKIGADCAFFIKNKAVFASGIGNKFEEIKLNLKGYYILLVKPDFSINTAIAFKGIKPAIPKVSIKELIKYPLGEWKNQLKNNFETPLFLKYPELNKIKSDLYNMGAEYASMSGSGSAMYGIFNEIPETKNLFNECFVWKSKF